MTPEPVQAVVATRLRRALRARRVTLGTIIACVAAACGGGSDGKQVLTVYSPHGKELLEHYA
ncbi:MAG: hypothetical protein M3Y64_11645, partial [Gemmatimonadota bacterium]|nr:hypothetical protein [Gemmatimonadota bacterium]